MAILTDKQMLWIAGGALLLGYVAKKKAEDAFADARKVIGDAINYLPNLPEDIYENVIAPPFRDTAAKFYSQMELDWLTDVKGITGLVARSDDEKRMLISHMPSDLTQVFDFLLGPYIAMKAKNAADEVRAYRKKKGLPA